MFMFVLLFCAKAISEIAITAIVVIIRFMILCIWVMYELTIHECKITWDAAKKKYRKFGLNYR